MRHIKKNSPPRLFQSYIRKKGASFEEMDPDVKEDLRNNLLKEQGGLCAYCQRLLRDQRSIKIEHHCERSICNGKNGTIDKRLEYKNLFAVCLGKNGFGREQHCDSKKAEDKVKALLPMKLNPLINAHIKTILYRTSGLLVSTNQEFENEINNVLNLNISYLKDLRKRKWIQIFKYSRNTKGVVNKDKMRRLLNKDLENTNGVFANHFPGQSEYMLRKFC